MKLIWSGRDLFEWASPDLTLLLKMCAPANRPLTQHKSRTKPGFCIAIFYISRLRLSRHQSACIFYVHIQAEQINIFQIGSAFPPRAVANYFWSTSRALYCYSSSAKCCGIWSQIAHMPAGIFPQQTSLNRYFFHAEVCSHALRIQVWQKEKIIKQMCVYLQYCCFFYFILEISRIFQQRIEAKSEIFNINLVVLQLCIQIGNLQKRKMRLWPFISYVAISISLISPIFLLSCLARAASATPTRWSSTPRWPATARWTWTPRGIMGCRRTAGARSGCWPRWRWATRRSPAKWSRPGATWTFG